jgi:predicted SprT family Zn-dependent metalloprotease
MELRQARDMATQLLTQHGLHDWHVGFDRAKRRAGQCRYDEHVISLSAGLTRLHSADEVRETVLHEIAHALVGPEAGHGPVWQATARSIGSDASRCLAPDAPRLPGVWLGVCPAGHTVERHRRPERVLTCPRCSATFSVDHVFEWTRRGVPAAMHPNYVAELRDLRSGGVVSRFAPGSKVRVTAPGVFEGRVGTVVTRGRTSYHVRLGDGMVRVLFAAVEAAT